MNYVTLEGAMYIHSMVDIFGGIFLRNGFRQKDTQKDTTHTRIQTHTHTHAHAHTHTHAFLCSITCMHTLTHTSHITLYKPQEVIHGDATLICTGDTLHIR